MLKSSHWYEKQPVLGLGVAAMLWFWMSVMSLINILVNTGFPIRVSHSGRGYGGGWGGDPRKVTPDPPYLWIFSKALPPLPSKLMPPMGTPPPPPPLPLPHQSNIYVTKKFIFGCSHCICTIFILTSYTLYTQVKPILILINVQYLQNVVFGLEKGLNGQNHFSGFHHHVNWKFPIFSGGGLPPSLFEKPCSEACRDMHWVMVLVQSTQHICFFQIFFLVYWQELI